MLRLAQDPDFQALVVAAILLLAAGLLPTILMNRLFRAVWLTIFGILLLAPGLFLWTNKFDHRPASDISEALANFIAMPLLGAGAILAVAAILSWWSASRARP